MTAIDDKLKGLLGDRYISGNAEEVSKFFIESNSSTGLAVAYAKTHEEVREIVKSANESGTSIFTGYDKCLPQEISGNSGIILDFKEMKEIERLDKTNLLAHMQCGITFDEFQKELKKNDLKIQTPVAVTNDSVVKNFVNRAVIKAAAKYPEEQITNMYVTLADGRLHKTGNHSFDEMASDSPDGAAYLSYWYSGSRDVYGVVSRGSIALYPIWEKRDLIAFDFDDSGGLLSAMRDIPRREIGIEYLGMDNVYLEKLTGSKSAKWTLAVGFDGFEEHVIWQEKIVRELAAEMGGKENKKLSESLLDKIDDAWLMQGACHTEFLTLFNRVGEFEEIIGGESGKAGLGAGDIGRLFVAMDRGRSVTCVYEFYKGGNGTGKFVDELNMKLLKQGAYFDTPQGDLSKAVFDSIEGYSAQLKVVKDMLDPKGILNPGILKF